MTSMLDRLERHFAGLRDRLLARSDHNFPITASTLGWRVAMPTKPNELYTAYFLWPRVLVLLWLFLPSVALIIHPHSAHSQFLHLAAAALLAGHDVTARLYIMLDLFARATPYFGAVFFTLVQVLILYDLLSMCFWNRRARRLRANPLPRRE